MRGKCLLLRLDTVEYGDVMLFLLTTDSLGAAFGRNQIRNTNIEIQNNFK